MPGTAATPTPTPQNTFDYFINITIGTLPPLRLDAGLVNQTISNVQSQVKNGFAVHYKADSFDTAFSLGTLANAQILLNDLANQLGIDASAVDVSQFTGALQNTVLSSILAKIENIELRITDLEFDTQKKSFTLGLGFDLGTEFKLANPPLGVRSFGFVLTHKAS